MGGSWLYPAVSRLEVDHDVVERIVEVVVTDDRDAVGLQADLFLAP